MTVAPLAEATRFLEAAMWRSMLKTVVATATFGLVHSALATRAIKRQADRRLGPHASDGPYRLFYIAQSAATTAALVAYVRRLPDRTLYDLQGLPRLALRLGQAASLAFLAWGVREIGATRLTGLDGLDAWRRGEPDPAPTIESQGPAPAADGTMRPTGPFRWTRHPLNLAAPALLWLNPRMTTNLLAFNLAATAYFVLGSRHEEARLEAAYGRAYRGYQHSGVPFFLPRPGAGTTPTPSSPAHSRVERGQAPQPCARRPISGG